MAARSRLLRVPSGSAWLYAALLLGVFASAAVAGYVYQYDPPRDRVVLAVDTSTPPSDVSIVAGTVAEVHADRIVIEREGQRIELALPDGVSFEDLQRSAEPLAPGTAVNVGAEQTDFGLVFTGIVAVEDGRLEAVP